MEKIIVIEDLCPQNHACPAAKACPVHALEQEGFQAPKINYDSCIQCGKCIQICPKGALKMNEEALE